jgi:hypothetical protein
MFTLLVVLATITASADATTPGNGWSPVVRLPHANGPRVVAVAADARGDAAVAWFVASSSRTAPAVVRVAVRRGRVGAWSERLLRSARQLDVGGVAVAVASSGEVTVAWIDQIRGGQRTVRAAYATPAGRWSTTHAVGIASPLHYAYPRLAVAADGTVALVYNAAIRSAQGMAVAWRRPGRSFAAPVAVPGGQLSEPTLVFDQTGRAFLAGTAQCDNESHSHGVLLTASASSHRFGLPRTITPTPATQVRFTLTGVGQGVAAWVGAGCSTSELLSGPVSARRVSTTRTGPVTTVEPIKSNDLHATRAPVGLDLTFTTYTKASGTPLTAHVNADGTALPPGVPSNRWMPVAADSAGDQLLQTAVVRNFGPPDALAARAAW